MRGPSRGDVIAHRRAAACLAVGLLAGGPVLAACTPSGLPRTAAAGVHREASSAPAGVVAPRASRLRVAPALAAWRLHVPVSRANAFPWRGRILLAGGLGPGDISTAAVRAIAPDTGTEHRVGSLSAPVHDAGGTILRGTPYLFGGGSSASTSLVQTAGASHTAARHALPAPRSDAAAVAMGGAAYLVGGYDGQRWSAAVLRTRDARRFRRVARLPVPVRYPAVVATRGDIFVFGGQTPTGSTSAIQRIDPATGRAAVVAHLPVRLTGASALLLDGRMFVCGGESRGTPQRGIYRFDAGSATVERVGDLPRPIAYAAAVVARGAGYLLGGETDRPTRQVEMIRMRPAHAPSGSTQ